ncbi:MAG: SDR family NAD(P)-dependent oxidoreductase [Burkholderiaceae bacterium]|nr:SDR family NAD(P)-dependent oxidoreductase [Burkholderiaceae bacterium]
MPGAPAQLHAQFPDADVLIKNAGATPRGDLLQLEEDAWRAGWELKLFGYINATRAYYRSMCERKSGVIINIIAIDGGFGARACPRAPGMPGPVSAPPSR